jgi:hypothetical protein
MGDARSEALLMFAAQLVAALGKRTAAKSTMNQCRLRLEPLEERRLLSVAPGYWNGNNVFIRYNDGQLYEHTSQGAFQFIDINTVKVVTGRLNFGDVAYILYNNSALYVWVPNTGFHLIDVNVADMSAALGQNGDETVFILYTNGQVFEHTGESHLTGFTYIDSNAIQVSAGAGSDFSPAAYIVYNNHALYEWSPHDHFIYIDTNVARVSADIDAQIVFIVYENGELFQHSNYNNKSAFQFLDVNVADVSAGLTAIGHATGLPAVFILYTNNQVYECKPGNSTFFYIDSNAVAIDASQGQSDTVFIVYDNTDLFENTNVSKFTFIDVNVDP